MHQHADHLPFAMGIEGQPTSARNHPLAAAIVEAAMERGNRFGEAREFQPSGQQVRRRIGRRREARHRESSYRGGSGCRAVGPDRRCRFEVAGVSETPSAPPLTFMLRAER